MQPDTQQVLKNGCLCHCHHTQAPHLLQLLPAPLRVGPRGPSHRDSSFLSIELGQFPAMITNIGLEPKLPTSLAHLLRDNDQKCDEILGVQHEVFFVHNVAQRPGEEISPESAWDKADAISRKTNGGKSRPGLVGHTDLWHTHDTQALGGGQAGSGCSLGRARA